MANRCVIPSTIFRTDGNKPFAIDRQKPAGSGFYSEGMSYKEFKVWVELHPEEREELESPVTVVRRVEQAAQYPVPLEVTPYSQEYTQFLAPAANQLLQVSRNSLSPSFLFHTQVPQTCPRPPT